MNKKMKNIRFFKDEEIRAYAFLEEEKLLSRLSSKKDGLTREEAEERQEEFGPNVITAGTRDTALHRLREAVINPFNVILLIIAAVTYFTDVMSSSKPDYLTVGIIVCLVVLSSMVAFVQSQRSNAAAEKLSEMISNKADVLRDGVLTEIPMNEVVPGDIVRLSAGHMIPADVRFLATKDTFLAQAALTGESAPVEKFSQAEENSADALTDLKNMGFMGSNVVSGSATAVVLMTGNSTYFGSMAQSLSGDRAKTSFERGVDSVSRLLVRMMFIMVPIVFFINGFAKGDWAAALLFSFSIAVGLTPEMLPMIMTSTLAKGAVSMSRHKVIVRTLGAIQTFGEMDVLCTDKTGTLTEDKVVLEKYMDIRGEEILEICSFMEINGSVLPMDEETRNIAMATYSKYNEEGLRMIAVAQKNEVPGEGTFGVADEKDMVLIGFVGFLDPPKESAGAAISALLEHGVRTVVLTGDSEGVAAKVCSKVGVDVKTLLTGRDVEKMTDEALLDAVESCNLFAKLSPSQKERVVKAFQTAGHTVGYMGDGINDAPALHQADVGISIDSAVDIAKETADIILLEKDLMVLEEGVLEGRRTFGNIIKYIKMAASGNFGNMISVIAASVFLPFLPMLPVQILTQNLLCDFSQMGIPFDRVDQEY